MPPPVMMSSPILGGRASYSACQDGGMVRIDCGLIVWIGVTETYGPQIITLHDDGTLHAYRTDQVFIELAKGTQP